MHDTLISRDIIGAAQKQGKVKAITVEVGELGHVPAAELAETLRTMVPGWKVKITHKAANAKCICGFTGKPKILEHTHGHSVYVCPKCGNVPELLEGQDIVLKQVVIE
jgi:Zn finger protein HypA/HybF involved in hydrogenase expression